MFDVDIEGETELIERFAAMPGAIRAALAIKLGELAQQLESKIKDDKLGGQILEPRSGALRDSISVALADGSANVFSRGVKYAVAQEYGFSGAETVAAHSRLIKEAFGKAISPKTIFVRSYSRRMNQPERSFMRSALQEMQDDIRTALTEAVEEGLHQ
jgi:hypothetical protein